MKKFYLLSFLLFVAYCLSAQTFQVRISETTTVVNNNDTLYASGSADQFDIKTHFDIENLTDADIMLHFVRENINLPEGMESVFCLNVCFPSSITEVDKTLSAAEVQPLDVDLWPNNNNGIAVVKITISNRDAETISFFVKFDVAPVGINTIRRNDFLIYPNPIENTLNINYTGYSSYMTIFDIVGKIVFEKELDSKGIHKVDFSEFISGVYLVKFTENNKVVYTQKVLKE